MLVVVGHNYLGIYSKSCRLVVEGHTLVADPTPTKGTHAAQNNALAYQPVPTVIERSQTK